MGAKKSYQNLLKPFLDRISAFLLFIFLSPLFFITILILSLTNKGRVFFLHHRIGYKERPFSIIKFRTMIDGVGHSPERITKLGKLLRRLSIDELPQLINVLKGEMSLVGPRPLLVEYLEFYNDQEKQRHTVKPGITGLAQVNGRNALEWEKRMDYDRQYVEHLSFWLDFKILILTITQLLKIGQSDFPTQNQEPFIEYAKRRG